MSNQTIGQIVPKGIKLRHLSMAILPVLLAACSGLPPAVETTPIIAKPSIPLQGAGYEVYGANQVPSSMASVRWQSFYTDPKLATLIQLGLDNNKDIKQALLAIQKAQAQYQIVDNRDLPSLGASGGYTRSATNAVYKNPNSGYSGYSANLALSSYELDFWGKVASLEDQALQSFLATTAAKNAAEVSLIANIAKSYVNLSYQLKQLELASKTLESREESLRITTARLNAGIDPKSPSLQAAASVETARIAALNAQSNVLQAKNALKYLIGVPLDESLMPEPAVTNITSQAIMSAGLPSELLLYRPDVLQAEYQLKAAGANIDVARANYYPSISLTGRLGYSSGDLDNLFSTDTLGWSFGPSISVPLFDGGQLDANYEVAQIERDHALASYERAPETAFREVSDVLASRATLDARLDSQYRLQKSFDEIYNISEARYIAQVDDYLSVLDAQRSLFSTQQSILALEQERLINQIELYQALGGGANLVEPIVIPTEQYPNVVDILTPQTAEQKAVEAIEAASAPVLVTAEQAAVIEAGAPVTLVQDEVVETVDLDADPSPEALIMQQTSTELPAGTTVVEDNGDAYIVPAE